MSNPYFLIPSVSGFKKTPAENSVFKPTLLESVSIEKIVSQVDTQNFVTQYIKAVEDKDEYQAIESLKKIFLQKNALYQALVEGAIATSGVNDLALTELVFYHVLNDVSGTNTILLTKELAKIPDITQSYDNYLANQLEIYQTSKKTTKKYKSAEEIVETIKGNRDLEELLGNLIEFNYEALRYANPYYYPFIQQVKELGENNRKKLREKEIVLKKGTVADRRLGAILEERIQK